MSLRGIFLFEGLIGLGAFIGTMVTDSPFGAVYGGLSVMLAPVMIGGGVCLIEPFFTGRPEYPRCGRCGAERYKVEWEMRRLIAHCSCGASYTRRGRQFLIVTAGGGSRPYLRWHLLRGWIAEHGPETAERLAPYRGSR